MARSSWFFASLALSGCITANVVDLESGADKIELDRNRPPNCDLVADVHGESRSEDEKEARKGAENDIRNQTMAVGGDHVVVEHEQNHREGTSPFTKVFLVGKALRCNPPEEENDKKKGDESKGEGSEGEGSDGDEAK